MAKKRSELNPIFTEQGLSIVVVSALSLTGVMGLLYATRWGIGTSPDSVAYIGAARNLLDSRGLSLPYGNAVDAPMTHHAPLYSVLLAMIGAFGKDPLQGARWLNAFLFGVNIFLVGIIVDRFTRRLLWLPVIASLLVLTSGVMLTIHAVAWTEPTFILLGFLGLFLLAIYFENSKRLLLIAPATLIGLATLTRYAGLALIVTGVLGILLFSQRTFYRKTMDALIFGIIGSFPMFVWMLRNLWIAGTATNRDVFFHPVSRSHAWQVLYTLSAWLLLPDTAPNIMRFGLWLVIFIGVLTILLLQRRERRLNVRKSLPADVASTPYIVKLLAIFLVIYGVFLVVSISFLDANTPLDNRILSPVYISLVILSLYFARELLRFAREIRAIQGVLIGVCLVFSTFYVLNGVSLIFDGHNRGIGFSSLAWQQSEILEQVRKLPAGVPIFSNAPEAIYLHTGRPALPLPRKVQATTQQINTDYFSDLAGVKEQIENERGVVVYFNTLRQGSSQTVEELKGELPLRILSQASDATVYVVDPTRQWELE